MVRRAWKGISYANVVSTLALFIALGGVSYAAVTLPARSVGTRQLKNNAVNGAKVRNHSLTARDIVGGLPAGPAGAEGPAGPAGSTGPAGAGGAPGAKGDEGPPGAKGDDGAPGTDGMQGPSGVVLTRGFSGSIGTVTGTGPGIGAWQFVGGTEAATITAGQRITATASFALGAPTSTTVAVSSDICVQPLSTGIVTPVGNHLTTSVSTRQVLSATQTFTPSAGFTTVGACVAISSTQTLDNNNNTDGWFIVTN